MKIKITLVKLGHIEHIVNFKKLEKWKSNIFEITELQCIEDMPDGDISDFYLDQKFSKEELKRIVSHSDNSDITIALMPCRFTDNFYMHRIGDNCLTISLYDIPEILMRKNISVENFIIKQIYEICAFKYLFKDISTDEIYILSHRDTKGCLFDLNGNRIDILYNTEKPTICDSCKTIFRKKQIDSRTISLFEKELRKIKKPLILRIEQSIKKYPLGSVVLSGLFAILLSITANLASDLIKEIISNCSRN